jgi:hypothetical protein
MSTEIEKAFVFTVPGLAPPSVNHYTRSCYYRGKDGQAHKGKKLTKEAQAFRDAVAIFNKGRTVAPATDAERRKVRYEVVVTTYLGPRQRLDSDNALKVAIDALQNAGAIHSDAFVYASHSEVVKDQRHNPRTVFLVRRMES